MSRTDQLCMAACMMALDEAGIGPRSALTGIVLGTAVGSGSALLRFLRDTFEQERPYLVNPSHFPGTLMNSAAGKTAIRLALTGVNASVSGGSMAAMHALHYARNVLVAGHAHRLLAGGVEELSAEGAWAWHRSNALAKNTVLAEGCAMFVLDVPQAAAPATHHAGASQPHRGRSLLGRLLACDIRFADPANDLLAVSGRLADCIHVALARSGASPKEVAIVAPGAGGRRGWAAVEERALRRVFPNGSVPRRLRVNRVLGETYSAGVALQLAAVLARWQYPTARTEDLAERERVAVLTSVNTEGSVGCLVVAHPDYT
jgi:3-oxoacyl-[acyl-carrier-protein] synthase II